jgi:hypothetical protein
VDRYIDYQEVSEYGRYFVNNVLPLVGASPLVDVEMVRRQVLAAVEALEAHLQGAHTQKSTVRSERGSIEETVEAMRDLLRRFYRYLQSLPPQTKLDMVAFFAAGKLGNLGQYKPEDVLAQADGALRGFSAPAHAALPGATTWQADIVAARTTLSDAIAGKHGASSGATTAVGSLGQAREDFLHVYNKVAKRLIRGLLADLQREHELRRYFRDLQVHEDRAAAPGEPSPPDTLPDDEDAAPELAP